MTRLTRSVIMGQCVAAAGVPVVPTHGLRHSTAELYMSNGASRDDLRILFAHSSNKMTDRYVHDRGRRLDQVASNVILIRPRNQDGRVSPKFPKGTFAEY